MLVQSSNQAFKYTHGIWNRRMLNYGTVICNFSHVHNTMGSTVIYKLLVKQRGIIVLFQLQMNMLDEYVNAHAAVFIMF